MAHRPNHVKPKSYFDTQFTDTNVSSYYLDRRNNVPLFNEEPTMVEFLGAKLRQSFPSSALNVIREVNTNFGDKDLSFEALDHPRFAEDGDLFSVKYNFAHADNYAHREYLIQKHDERQRDLKIINDRRQTFGLGLLTDIGTDPISYVPLLGPWARGAKASHRAMAAGAVSATVTVPYEMIRHADDPTRTAGETALTVGGMFVLNSALASALGKPGNKFKPNGQPIKGNLGKFDPSDPRPKGVGAGAVEDPRVLRWQETMRSTGIGIEQLKLNPLLRLLQNENPDVTNLAMQLMESGGIILNKVDDQIPMLSNSVSQMFKSTYLSPMVQAIHKADDAFLRYRGITPKSTGVTANAFKNMGLAIKDWRSGNTLRLDFNRRVGEALMRNGDVYDDAMTPFVTEAFQSYKSLFDFVRTQATGVRLWTKEIDKKIAKAQASGARPEVIRRLENAKARITAMGPQATLRSQGYFPRNYDVQYLLTNEGTAHFIRTLTPHVGRQQAEEALKRITNSYDETLESFDFMLDEIGTGSSQLRLLDVDDEILVPFIDFNVESVVRDHVRRMGIDIELTRKFGDVGMEDVIARLPSQEVRRDVMAIRDLLRGTYGRPNDPYSHLNRGIGLIKNFSPLVYMGGATVTSLTDLARPIMTEGINEVAGTMLKSFLNSNRELMLQMNRSMVREVGEALDMTLSMRAMAMADVGSTFGRMGYMEKTVRDLQAPFFLLNGLNYWNTIMKEFAGLIISQRMIKGVRRNWQSLSKSDKDKFLANGIDGPMALRIKAMLDVPEFNQVVDGSTFPMLATWTDTGAADAFKRALNQQINRTIVTPDVGDKALWTQTHVGGMIAQFKSFGQAATQRVLISGLQERNSYFYQGVISMTALGLLVNEIKDFQYGRTDTQRTWGQTLANAADRAGVFAIFSDFNHAMETISSNRIGLDPAMGGEFRHTNLRTLISEVGPGPTILYDIADMAKETVQGNAFEQNFMNSLRRVSPYSTHPLFPNYMFNQ